MTTYGDLRGTASFDRPDPSEQDALYELAGLSSEHWTIVGIELFGGHQGSGANVWAIPVEEATHEVWEAQARAGAKTAKAHRFSVLSEEQDAVARLLAAYKRWSVNALYRSLVELGLTVEPVDD